MKSRLYVGLGIVLVVVVAITIGIKLNTTKSNLPSTELVSAQTATTTAQNGLASPLPKIVSKDSTFQKTGFLGLGSLEMAVTANITNKGGPGQVTVTATTYGGRGSQSKSTSIFLVQGEWQQVIIIIPNLEGNESYNVIVQ